MEYSSFNDIGKYMTQKIASRSADLTRTFFQHFNDLANNNGILLPMSWEYKPLKPKYTNFVDATQHFFLKKIETKIDIKKYHEVCAPKYCEYLEKQELNLSFLLGVIVGVAGSISAFYKAIFGACTNRGAHKSVESSDSSKTGNGLQQQPIKGPRMQQVVPRGGGGS